MEKTYRAYGYLILTMILVGFLGGVIALRLHEINVSPFVFLMLPLSIGYSIKAMIKYFKQAFRV